MQKRTTLSNSDWMVLEALWDQPMILAELILRMERETGWNKSTTATVIRRLIDKGLVGYTTKGRTKTDYPLLQRDDACAREAAYLLQRAYGGSISRLVRSLARRGQLTGDEVTALREVLREAEEHR